MRWIVLALSLGAMIVSLIHGLLAILVSGRGAGGAWMINLLLLIAAAVTLIGGVLAFNGRKKGGIFLVASSLICFSTYSSTGFFGLVIGMVNLVGGVLTFLIRSSSEYDEEDDDEVDNEDGYEYEAEVTEDRSSFGTHASSGRRELKERASRINLDMEEYSLSGDGVSKGSPHRIRSSKVCPACGASVGIEHKFCYTCGKALLGPRAADIGAGIAAENLSSTASSVEDLSLEQKNLSWLDKDEESINEFPEEGTPHRIFVKPSREEETDLINPYMVDPDDSYQEFSNYTRRRKRTRSSLARRILGLLILLLAVFGAAWLLLGMRKVPEPVPPVVVDVPIIEPEPVIKTPEPAIWEQLQVGEPTRGIVTGSNVNIRQNHSTDSQVVTRISAGVRADVIGRWEGTTGTLSGPWFNIRFDGREGWIYGLYFQPLDGRQATLPGGYSAALLGSFGSVRAELTEHLGQPTRQTPAAMTWTGLTADLRGDDVIRLQVTGAQHVLQNEIAVGITEDTLYKRVGYPSDYRANQLRYVESSNGGTERGMAVRLQNGRVQSITFGNI